MGSEMGCVRPWQAVSNGLFQRNVPIDYAVPLLIIQIVLVIVVTRSMALILKPLRQPRVLAEVIGGVLLGPSALGHVQVFTKNVFPKASLTLLDTVATLGLLFFLFMVGLELDLKEIRKSGKNSLILALAGIAGPFLLTAGVAVLVRAQLMPGVQYAPLLVFMAVPMSITAFAVLVRILAERKLLNTEVGQLVLPAAAINDVCAWILLAIGVALSGSNQSPLTPLLVLLSGGAFVVFMLTATRSFMEWVANRANHQESVSEIYVMLSLLGVLISGFTTEAIGIHPLFGAFMFGLVVPKEGMFVEALINKVEDFVTILMLPLFFAASGLKTDLSTMSKPSSFGFLLLFMATAAVGKIGTTIAVARLKVKLDWRRATALGFLMNTKGLVELIILNIGKDLEILDDQLFASLVLMCLLTTFVVTPVVVALYKPSLQPPAPTNSCLLQNVLLAGKLDQFRIMACLHGTRNIPSMIRLVEASAGNPKIKSLVRVFVVHLIELSERVHSSVLLASKSQKEGRLSNAYTDAGVFVPFETLSQFNKAVSSRALRVLSELADMHQDICAAAAKEKVNLIILPFHKFPRENDGDMEVVNPGFCAVNQKVLRLAPCSVAILVDRGFRLSEYPSKALAGPTELEIGVLFFGGPDDREALAFGARLAEQPGATLSVIRYLPGNAASQVVITLLPQRSSLELRSLGGSDYDSMYQFSALHANADTEREYDDEAIEGLKSARPGHNYEDVVTEAPIEAVVGIARSGRFTLLVVGRGRFPSILVANLADWAADSPELGPIGDVLAGLSSTAGARSPSCSGNGATVPSVLVVQQYNASLPQESAIAKEIESSAEEKSDTPPPVPS